MPVIKSAKKKLRQDKKRTLQNNKIRVNLKSLIKRAKKTPSDKKVVEAIKALDKAAKKHILHKNKASRIKSTLSKLLGAKQPKKVSLKTKTIKSTKQTKKEKLAKNNP